MLLYEIKKVILKPATKIVLALLAALLLVVCCLAVSCVYYVDDEGNITKGIKAVRTLRDKKMEWAGELTEDVLKEALRQNALVNSSEEYLSQNVQENNKAYAKKQGFSDIRKLISCSFCDFREYDYYRADSIREEEIGQFYENRTLHLAKWLYSGEAEHLYSEAEKQFLIGRYDSLKKPLYYEYTDGWAALLEYAPSLIMFLVLLTGFLVSGIFPNEFQWRSDAVFFSSKYGRDKAAASKVLAGFCIVTAIYLISMSLYSVAVLGILGTDGASCPIQVSLGGWKSFYHITFWEDYLLTVLGGYIGNLFILALSMLVSAKTRSPVLPAAIPFLVVFLPVLTSNLPVLSKVMGLFPDQLLQICTALRYFNLYQLGGEVIGAIPILLVSYTLLSLLLPPVLYQVYRKTEIT